MCIRDSTIGELALQNQCPPIAELLSPLSYAHAVNNNWDEALKLINTVDRDPFGFKPIIEIANDLRKGSEISLNKWALKGDPNNPEATTESVKQSLRERAEILLK